MSVKVTIIVEHNGRTATTIREGAVTVPGGRQEMVLPILASAAKAAAADHLDEIGIVKSALDVLTAALGQVAK